MDLAVFQALVAHLKRGIYAAAMHDPASESLCGLFGVHLVHCGITAYMTGAAFQQYESYYEQVARSHCETDKRLKYFLWDRCERQTYILIGTSPKSNHKTWLEQQHSERKHSKKRKRMRKCMRKRRDRTLTAPAEFRRKAQEQHAICVFIEKDGEAYILDPEKKKPWVLTALHLHTSR